MIALAAADIHAQDSRSRFGFEFNGGWSLPVRKIENYSMKPGFGFEGLLHYSFIPALGVYGGWGWNRLAPYSATDHCYEETGYVLGLNFRFAAVNEPTIAGYLRAGVIFDHVETEDSDGRIINDTGHGPGFQVAGGVEMSLGKNWSFTPGIRFNSLAGEETVEGETKQRIYQYLSARIGFLKRF